MKRNWKIRAALLGLTLGSHGHAAQSSPASVPAPSDAQQVESSDGVAAEPEPLPAWGGTTAAGLAELALLARGDDLDGALELGERLLAPDAFTRWRRKRLAAGGWDAGPLQLADPVLDALGLNGPPPALRAEVQYARGLVLARKAELGDARGAFLEAAQGAGPSQQARELRLASLYDAGTVTLEAAEALRLEVPEVRAALGLPSTTPPAPLPGALPGAPPGAPGAHGTAGASDEDVPDPLELARTAYLEARDTLVTRLRADWRDLDCRANLELCERRLRELDEIESRREKESQDQQDPNAQKDPNSQESEDSQKEKQEGQDGQSSPSEEPDSDGQQPPNEDREDSESQDAERPEDQPETPPESPETADESQESQEPEDSSTDESAAEDGAADAEETEERVLTEEEVTRLLDQLQQIEQQAEAVRARLRARGRRPVEKDW